MSKVQMLRALVKQRLTAAAEDIFGLFERTIAEYEEELCRSTEEKERQRKLLDAVFNPEVRLHRAEEKERQRKLLDAVFNPEVRLHRADVQQLLVSKEEVPPEQQEWSPLLDREDPPEPPHIKEEEKELWSSQEGERLQGPEEADITKVTVTSVSLKAEDDEEKPQSSQLHQTQSEQMETEAGGEDCGGPEPAGNSDPERHLQPDTDDKTEDSSETEDSDDDWKMSREPQSHFNTHKQNEVTGSHMTCITGERPFLLHSCSECGKRFGNKTSMKVHMRIHTEEKPFSCLVCGRIFAQGENLRQHMAVHSGKKGLRCAVCDKRFSWYKQFKLHKCVSRQSSQSHQRQTEQIKTEADGEDCGGPAPARNSDPGGHLTPDTDNMTEDSSETDDLMETREPQTDSNTQNKNCVPVSHKTCFTGEKLFSCCKCGKSFEHKSHLKRHMKIHPQEKPFSCSVCGKRFTQKGSVRIHMAMHSGEKQYSCNVCGNRFTWKSQLRVHQCVAESSQLHQRQTV